MTIKIDLRMSRLKKQKGIYPEKSIEASDLIEQISRLNHQIKLQNVFVNKGNSLNYTQKKKISFVVVVTHGIEKKKKQNE